MSIRVLLCDDQALVRSGFRMVLEAREDMRVIGEADDGIQAVALAGHARPDVILMDIRMPNMDGIEATRRLVAAGNPARILILTTYDADEYVFEALRAGASGFLLKDIRPVELVEAIRVIARGEALLAPTVTRRLIDELARGGRRRLRTPPGLHELTPREFEVLELVAQGLSNGEIAELLTVEETTIKTHVSRLLAKLGLRDRVQAVVLAYESGLAHGA